MKLNGFHRANHIPHSCFSHCPKQMVVGPDFFPLLSLIISFVLGNCTLYLTRRKWTFISIIIWGSNKSQIGLIVQWVTKALPWHCRGQRSSQVEAWNSGFSFATTLSSPFNCRDHTLKISIQYWGPARVNSDKRHGPKSSDSAQMK